MCSLNSASHFKPNRTSNYDRLGNFDAVLTNARKEIAQNPLQDYYKGLGIFGECVFAKHFLREPCVDCHHTSEGKPYSFISMSRKFCF